MVSRNSDPSSQELRFWQLYLRDLERDSISKAASKLKDSDFNNHGYVASVAIALLIAAVLLGYYFFELQPNPTQYMSISILDDQKKTDNYPEYLVCGVNNTFSIYIEVKNQMKTEIDTEVRVRVIKQSISKMPLESIMPSAIFANKILSGGESENFVTITLDNPDVYSVVFELWTKAVEDEVFEFSDKYCVLNIKVV
jgi:hypothetical protein